MSLETGAFIVDLVETNPVGATDFVSQGDDHIRLLKVCIKGSFPNLGTGAVTCTVADLNKLTGLLPSQAELNFVDGVTSAIQTQLDAKASSAALASAISGLSVTYQPLDADLTAIAALTTTTFGRGFLDLADLAALATKINALVPTWTGAHTFGALLTANGRIQISGDAAVDKAELRITNTGSSGGQWRIGDGISAANGVFTLYDSVAGALRLSVKADGTFNYRVSGTDFEVGFRNLPKNSQAGSAYTLVAADAGKLVLASGSMATVNIPASVLAGESIVTVINDTAGAVSLAGSGGAGIYWLSGAGRVGPATRSLAAGAVATLFCSDGSNWYVWGNGIS